MAPPSLASPVLACMQEIQRECYLLGIPLKTRHREVAPNQYEFAPLFGSVLLVNIINFLFPYKRPCNHSNRSELDGDADHRRGRSEV